jgi:hypothetical protein
VQQQHGQHDALLVRPERNGSTFIDHLEWTENAELHVTGFTASLLGSKAPEREFAVRS